MGNSFNWYFDELRKTEPERSPHEAEFFKEKNIELTASLVREFIQNSLDARTDDNKVKIKIGLYDIYMPDYYLSNLLNHIKSCYNKFDDYSFDDPKKLVILEDFGTSGLDGPVEPDIDSEEECNYYNFWWREGVSQKHGIKAGRWGLGKTVFYMASFINSFWGYTVRRDGKKLLTGKTLLKPHNFEGKRYNYWGYFAKSRENPKDPITEHEQINDFKSNFKLKRNNEPGLSVIIPDASESITKKAIIRSSIIHYFSPIIKDLLEIEIHDENDITKINQNTLNEIASVQNWEGTDWESKNIDSLLIFLTDSVTTPPGESYELKPNDDESTHIDKKIFGDKLDEMKDDFNSEKFMDIKVPVTIKPVGEDPLPSFFKIFLQKNRKLNTSEEYYIRSGINIFDMKLLGSSPVRAMLTAYEEPVSRFLGDAETPAHTRWKENNEGFKDKYENAVSTLRYIKPAAREIVKTLDEPPEGLQEDFFKDIFYIKEEGGESGKSPGPTTDIHSNSNITKLNKIESGFHITLSDDFKDDLPISIKIVVAYDTISGNGINKYSEFDFNLKSDIEKFIQGGEIIDINSNVYKIKITNNDFSFKSEGFDQNRDLILYIKEL